MHYILFYDVVENYAERRAPFRSAHLELAEKFYDEGKLVLAGALADPIDGAVLVFSGEHPGAAAEFVAKDPYVENGLVSKWRIRKWSTVVGDASHPSV
jgi:uncharacterized protein